MGRQPWWQRSADIRARRRPPQTASECFSSERAAIKREIGRLQDEGPSADEQKMNALLVRSRELKQQIESLMEAESRS